MRRCFQPRALPRGLVCASHSALATSLGVSQATRFCSGVKFDPASPPASMARVYALTAGASIDWNGDGIT